MGNESLLHPGALCGGSQNRAVLGTAALTPT